MRLLATGVLVFVLTHGVGREGLAAEASPKSNPIAEAFPLIFDSEWIRLAILDDSLEVRGTYVCLCREQTTQPIALLYPFPQDTLMGRGRMLSLRMRVGSGPSVPSPWEDLPHLSGVRIWIPPCEGDTIVVEAAYRQGIVGGYARYIVTTTQIWGRPLRRARFEIRLPRGAVPLEFSYPFARQADDGDGLYTYEAQEFMPDRDIVVRWSR